MARSHLCASCGQELGKIAPTIEPHYGLPIVRCPRCSVVAVRTTARFRARIRRLIRLDAAIRQLAGTFILLLVIVGLYTGSLWEMSNVCLTHNAGPGEWLLGIFSADRSDLTTTIGILWDRDLDALTIMAGLAAILSGFAWSIILPHWKRWVLIVCWIAATAAAFPMMACADMCWLWLQRQMADPMQDRAWNIFGLDWEQAKWCCGFVVMLMPTALLGYPLGNISRRIVRSVNRSTLRKFRKWKRQAQGKL